MAAISVNVENKDKALIVGLTVLGNATGIAIAVYRKSGFWGGVGWFLLAGTVGGAVGAGINSFKK